VVHGSQSRDDATASVPQHAEPRAFEKEFYCPEFQMCWNTAPVKPYGLCVDFELTLRSSRIDTWEPLKHRDYYTHRLVYYPVSPHFTQTGYLRIFYGSGNITIISLTGINRLEFIMGRNKVKLSTVMLWRRMGERILRCIYYKPRN